MTVQVDVLRDCHDDSVPADEFIKTWVRRAVTAADHGAAEVAVRVVAAADMQALNREYRGLDKSTNVLSFPAGRVDGLPAEVPAPLGDIVVCAAVVSDEAQAQGKTTPDHWAHMLVHGTLHLLGYDHEIDEDAAEMETLETHILAEHGITDPYGADGRNC